VKVGEANVLPCCADPFGGVARQIHWVASLKDLCLPKKVLGFPNGCLYRAGYRIAADRVLLQLAGHHGQVLAERFDGIEISGGRREDELSVFELACMIADPTDLSLRRASAVIAESHEKHGLINAGRQDVEGLLDTRFV
jgi:hypothetical protein